MKQPGNAGGPRSIRSQMITTMIVSFFIMYGLLYSLFSMSMQQMLVEREQDSMFAQMDLAQNVLQVSMQDLPTLTSEWAGLSYTYDYADHGDLTIYNSHFLPDRSYDLNKLNLLTVLDLNHQVLFEKVYQSEEQKTVTNTVDLSSLYERLGAMAVANYRADGEYDNMGISGFVGQGDTIYYLSAYPIADVRGGRPVAGTFIFGRIIDEEELAPIINSSGVQLAVASRTHTELTEKEAELLATNGTIMRNAGNTATVYSTLTDMFGEPTLLVSVENSRAMYSQGRSFINLIVLFVALGCSVVLILTVKLLERIIVRPLTTLADEVNRIDMDTVDTTLPLTERNAEVSVLTSSINGMLERIRENRDIIQQVNESLSYNANYDLLTGLRNRVSTTTVLSDMINGARTARRRVTVYHFDLCRFKMMNDTMGHTMGDSLLVELSRRMSAHFGGRALLARMSGDKFLIATDEPQESYDCQAYAEEIYQLFAEPFRIKERELDISASMGSSIYPIDGQDAETLIKNAEIAMYRAKENGIGLYMPYQIDFHNLLQRKLYIENRLRAAISDGCSEFAMYFQPKVSMKTGQIDKCEALLRWISPEGIIGPQEFIPLAEESGLIIPLSWWIIEECCKRGRAFADSGTPIAIAINIPAQVLMHERFLLVLREAIAESGIEARLLDIEITEGTLLEDMSQVNAVLSALHSMGIEISVDDFGTGYSSLSYLNKLAIDRIKIDRSFVAEISHSEDSRALVRAIIAMARSLHIVVTAEGVEDSEQYSFLQEIDCNEAQGYLISPPLPHEPFFDFCLKWNQEHSHHPLP